MEQHSYQVSLKVSQVVHNLKYAGTHISCAFRGLTFLAAAG